MRHELVYHTRHIPIEYINQSTPMGRQVVENKLCTFLQDERLLQTLKETGVKVIETRLVWTDLEKEPGHFDWTRLDRDIGLIRQAGFKAGIFPWFQHPPAWENSLTRLQCLEHGGSSSIISLWDPGLLVKYDELYQALAECYQETIDFLYVGIYGDYGEVLYPTGVKHYYFSPPHGHAGYWCGDALARQDFQAWLLNQYGDIGRLNAAWQTSFAAFDADLMPGLPLERNNLARRLDFARWYTQALLQFTEKVCRIARSRFPATRLGIPLGSIQESLELGQIKSEAVRIAAKYQILARWTGVAHLNRFDRSNTCSRRISSPARFYGTGFGTEAALILAADNAAPALYESLANSAVVIHNDPGNIVRSLPVQLKNKDVLRWLPIQCPIAVFYPLEGEQCHCLGKRSDVCRPFQGESPGSGRKADEITPFLDACQSMRARFDFEIFDSLMIMNGCLAGIRDLIIPLACPLPEKAAGLICGWLSQGGTLWLKNDHMPWIMESQMDLADYLDQSGFPVQTFDPVRHQPVQSRCWLAESWPEFEPYASLTRKEAGQPLITVHDNHVYSQYDPITQEITICAMQQDS
jgi:hypothetical protein